MFVISHLFMMFNLLFIDVHDYGESISLKRCKMCVGEINKHVLAGNCPSIPCETEVPFKFLHFGNHYTTLWPAHLVKNKTLGESVKEIREG